MAKCFVIQPFDAGRFDKLFEDVYKPAIEAAGLDPYRSDRDPNVEIPIDSIEDGIRGAAVCLADISRDNPNVWYELGFAFAVGRPVILICSNERDRYPFDIRHRAIIRYSSEAPSDFEKLKKDIQTQIIAKLSKTEVIRQIVEEEQVAPHDGLSNHELIVLAILAGEAGLPGSDYSLYAIKNDAERSGLTSIGSSLAIRRLLEKQFIQTVEAFDEYGNPYSAATITETAWRWIARNEKLFRLKKEIQDSDQDFTDDIPF